MSVQQQQSNTPLKEALTPSTKPIQNETITHFIYSEVYRLWNWGYKNKWGSPCLHPSSISKEEWKEVVEDMDNYYFSWKPDGVYYTCVMTRLPTNKQEVCVMIDRIGKCYLIPVVCDSSFFDGTLFAGELLWRWTELTSSSSSSSSSSSCTQTPTSTTTPSTPSSSSSSTFQSSSALSTYKKGLWRQEFAIFSLLCLKNQPYWHKTLEEKYKSITDIFDIEDDCLVDPKSWLVRVQTIVNDQDKVICVGNTFGLQFSPKEWVKADYLETLWTKLKNGKEKFDGLIIVKNDLIEKPGRHKGSYKWKWDNDLDFRFTKLYNNPQAPSECTDIQIFAQSSLSYQQQYQQQQQQQQQQGKQGQSHSTYLSGEIDVNTQANIVVLGKKVQFQMTSECRQQCLNTPQKTFIAEVQCQIHKPIEPSTTLTLTDESTSATNKAESESESDTMVVDIHHIREIRTNKPRPNDIVCVQNTVLNIVENMTIQEMLDDLKTKKILRIKNQLEEPPSKKAKLM